MKLTKNPHRHRSLVEFGETGEAALDRAKRANLVEAYGAGQVNIARQLGHYPPRGAFA